jgi:hypothetical protein
VGAARRAACGQAAAELAAGEGGGRRRRRAAAAIRGERLGGAGAGEARAAIASSGAVGGEGEVPSLALWDRRQPSDMLLIIVIVAREMMYTVLLGSRSARIVIYIRLPRSAAARRRGNPFQRKSRTDGNGAQMLAERALDVCRRPAADDNSRLEATENLWTTTRPWAGICST